MKSLYLLLASLRLALALSSSSKIPLSVLRGHTRTCIHLFILLLPSGIAISIILPLIS